MSTNMSRVETFGCGPEVCKVGVAPEPAWVPDHIDYNAPTCLLLIEKIPGRGVEAARPA